jgi:hypothetical protein
LIAGHLIPALSPCGEGDVAGDVMGQSGVGVGVAGAVGDGDKPARAGDERGHFAGGGVEVD